jgi:hydrogenase-4 transcriptional activator
MVKAGREVERDIVQLEEKCRLLETKCATYVDELKRANDHLEKLVAERTAEIILLKDRLQAENVFLKRELADRDSYVSIIGESHAIKSVIAQINLVASTHANVLIQGESGTGKELIAREIHKHGSRPEQPLIRVNCATIPKELYESEFFGHIKGAFTGAVKDRIGRFEAANGGTIFLDEVGEIPIDLQSKLLRVLQGGEYERLGEDITRKVDVRVIAATNRELKKEVATKRFRDDLFFRLNVFPIQIAPLRERKEDIPPLAMYFVEKLSEKLNRPCPRLTAANIMDLQNYHWPGNVRELENAIERALILSGSKGLRFDFLADALRVSNPVVDNVISSYDNKDILSETELTALVRKNTLRALKRSNWKIYGPGGASELIGIKPTTLIERMKRMKIQKPR